MLYSDNEADCVTIDKSITYIVQTKTRNNKHKL